MANEKQFNTRVQHKHDTEDNWLKAENFVPKDGELIVYDKDEAHNYPRVKIGDGISTVNKLPFIGTQGNWNQNDETQPNFIQGRTHWAECVEKIEFDGVFEDREIIHTSIGDVIKISDDIIPYQNMIGGKFILRNNTLVQVDISKDSIIPFLSSLDFGYAITLNGPDDEIRTPIVMTLLKDLLDAEGSLVVTKGTYIPANIPFPGFILIPNFENPVIKSVHKIDNKYLPDASVIKASSTFSFTYAELKNFVTIPSVKEDEWISLRPEVKIESNGGAVLIEDNLLFPASNIFIIGNASLIDDSLPTSPYDFCITLLLYEHDKGITLLAFSEDGIIFPDDSIFTFYYDIYTVSNLKMLPAPLVLEFDFKENVSNLAPMDREKIVNSLRIGRLVFAKYNGATILVKDFSLDMDNIGEIALSDFAGTVSYTFHYWGDDFRLEIKKQIAFSSGAGAPTESTYAAEVGALYVDTNTTTFYKCVAISDYIEEEVTYTWVPLVTSDVQADWNQNDETAPDFIKNRTHGIWNGEILPVTTPVFDEEIGAYAFNADISLIEGNSYVVNWNGVDYTTSCVIIEGAPCLGNVGAMTGGEDTGEPFIILYLEHLDVWGAMPLDGATEVTFSIFGEIINKIPDIYLPKQVMISGAANGSVRTSGAAAEDDEYSMGEHSFAEGYGTIASGPNSHAEGAGTTASGGNSHAEGSSTTASGPNSHAEGAGTTASGINSHAEGSHTEASGPNSHAEGAGTTALGYKSHAEGSNTTASGNDSHAEGTSSHAIPETITIDSTNDEIIEVWKTSKFLLAKGSSSHAEGMDTLALEDNSHAEGSSTTASGRHSHAEGSYTEASGNDSHAEGAGTTASGNVSHAEGYFTTASGNDSHAEGNHTTAKGQAQHVQGEYNIPDPYNDPLIRGKYAHIVGNGTSESNRSNAHTLDWNGNAWYAGDVFVGGTSQDSGEKLAKISDIPDSVLYTAQTLTKEQKAQARENIGADPVVIDLDTYGTIPINQILSGLFLQGGGEMENVDIGSLMQDINTDKPLCVTFNMSINLLRISGVTVVKQKNECVELCITGLFVYNGIPYLASMAINATSYANRSQATIVMSVEVPGALQEDSVQSVNGQTGEVQLTAADVGARPDDWMPTAQEVGLGNVDNVKQYSANNPPVVVQAEAPTDTSVIWVDPDDNSVDEFQEAVNTALAQAKASGEFNPVKGIDYWTSADQQTIIQQVIAALPVYNGEVV